MDVGRLCSFHNYYISQCLMLMAYRQNHLDVIVAALNEKRTNGLHSVTSTHVNNLLHTNSVEIE